MTEQRPPPESLDDPVHRLEQRRWIGPAILAVVVLVPILILVFSNLEATEVSWAGFSFDQPRWVVLLLTFVAGVVGGKLMGWAWRRWRRRRRKLKEELDVLRRHAADTEREEETDE